MQSPAVVIGLVLSIAVGPAIALAQMPGPGSMPGMAPEPSMAPADRARTGVPANTERTVKRVDPASNTITVGSGFFGLFGRTVDITRDTAIQVEGRKATLADIREGQRAKVSYESRAGRNVATRIEVMPADPSEHLADRR